MIADRQYTVIVQNTADVERIQRIPSAWSIQIFAKSHKKLLIEISHLVGKYIIANFGCIVKYWISLVLSIVTGQGHLSDELIHIGGVFFGNRIDKRTKKSNT